MIVIDMDMPQSCYVCKMRNVCSLAHNNGWINDKRDKFCPIKCDIEDIKAEIKEMGNTYGKAFYNGSNMALEIINKHIGGE